jgi:hypothetical protein
MRVLCSPPQASFSIRILIIIPYLGGLLRVVDRGIQANWILRFSSYTTSGLYDHILNDKDAAPIPLSDADKSKLAKEKSILYKEGVEGDYTDMINCNLRIIPLRIHIQVK